jgi:hypothetical protein
MAEEDLVAFEKVAFAAQAPGERQLQKAIADFEEAAREGTPDIRCRARDILVTFIAADRQRVREEALEAAAVAAERALDNCGHPDCVAERERARYSSCAGGHLAREVGQAIRGARRREGGARGICSGAEERNEEGAGGTA